MCTIDYLNVLVFWCYQALWNQSTHDVTSHVYLILKCSVHENAKRTLMGVWINILVFLISNCMSSRIEYGLQYVYMVHDKSKVLEEKHELWTVFPEIRSKRSPNLFVNWKNIIFKNWTHTFSVEFKTPDWNIYC